MVAYQDFDKTFLEVASGIVRNPTLVIRVRNRWVQEGPTDRHAGSQQPPGSNTLQVPGTTLVLTLSEAKEPRFGTRSIFRRFRSRSQLGLGIAARLPVKQAESHARALQVLPSHETFTSIY
ncbi:hypothetical protein TNCV_558841 [Trichonephila clavipes]|nr:hypothetical protein TNCV_558841 [Trichonephila clavipes]